MAMEDEQSLCEVMVIKDVRVIATSKKRGTKLVKGGRSGRGRCSFMHQLCFQCEDRKIYLPSIMKSLISRISLATSLVSRGKRQSNKKQHRDASSLSSGPAHVSNPPIRMSPEIQSQGQQQRTLLIAEEYSKCCGERRITQSDL
ncbi:uncharacterized protein BO72DRAFT_247975 [Aspergillus fijiensis CBS 313.89]|uniref:Uncharacterized protein n=1 Tax=Aspergillus fijiensis CBS 313.89 TaxID=1448319 RepID=A0A8G1VVL0_9EURO|nr:uncharacterized protein BO72DRAFT_247975 [Aspergillus fijiensis CBS 313.89]RAK73291.1 hypothetical protein BO72DRAFT_247975 [Aspergillus fijiensis CBS 313.89]